MANQLGALSNQTTNSFFLLQYQYYEINQFCCTQVKFVYHVNPIFDYLYSLIQTLKYWIFRNLLLFFKCDLKYSVFEKLCVQTSFLYFINSDIFSNSVSIFWVQFVTFFSHFSPILCCLFLIHLSLVEGCESLMSKWRVFEKEWPK